MTFSNTTRAFVIDRAATTVAIERYEAALDRVLQAVEAFSDLPEGQALRAVRGAHAAAEAEMVEAESALAGEIRRLRHVRPFPAVVHRGVLYAPAAMSPGTGTGAGGPRWRIHRVSVGDDIITLD